MKFLLVLSIFVTSCLSERILFIGIGSKSHRIGYMPIAKALADKGHQVTVISAYPSLHSSENIREIKVRDFIDHFQMDWFQMQKVNVVSKFKMLIETVRTSIPKSYDFLMESEEFQQIVRERDVDFVILSMVNEISLPIVDSLNVPFAYYIPQSASSPFYDAMEMSKEYASIPSAMLAYDSEMSFFQRLVNSLISELGIIFGRLFINLVVNKHVKKDFPNSRPIAEIKRDASLWFINHHVTTAYSRPFPPNVIPIGPLHVRPAKPLPENLQRIADESKDGFIVFSLGSIVSGSSVPPQLIQVFINVFSKFPQRIIWKREKDEKADLPPNVVIVDWIPQQDLIAHPNCRLLISHGGLLSLQEAIYHKMPFLGLPLGSDQQGNLARATKEGYAIKLDWDKLDESSLFNAISSLLNEPSYRANAVRLSNLMRDQLLPGEDMAVYWIEHVLRHGTTHLQLSSKNLNLIQKNLIDVWLFLAAILAVFATSSFLLLRFLCKYLLTIKQERVKLLKPKIK